VILSAAVATLTIRGVLTDATTGAGVPGFGITIEASVDAKYSVRTQPAGAGVVYLQPIDDDGPDEPLFETYTNTGSATPVTVTTGNGGEFEQQINMQAAERQARSIEDFFKDEGYTFNGGIAIYRVKVTARRPSGAVAVTASAIKGPQTAGFPVFEFNALRIPRRRVIILDIDGLRWDVFRAHLRTVRDSGAGLDRTYHFTPRDGATRNTVIGQGKDLRSGLAFLCFGEQMGRTEVRLARAPYPSYTFPSHGTMFTGFWPNLHGIAGNAYVKRDSSFQWKPRDWEALPDGPALQGYCTGSSAAGAAIDYWWDGLEESDENDCTDRNRGLVSDLPPSVTLYDRAAQAAGLRSLVIHNFYHSAAQPWTDAGKDIWWHMTNPEVRSLKDICSDEDADEAEPADSAAFIKAELALRFLPHTIRTPAQGPYPYPTGDFNYANLVDKLSGEMTSLYSQLEAQSDASGGPDILTIYVASVDNASHKKGTLNQATYLAWFDHRLAVFVKELMSRDPIRFNNTVFALVADHGHADLENPPVHGNNELAVREEICRLAFGDQEVEKLRRLVQLYPYLNYASMMEDAIEDVAAVFPQGMNLYVYLRDPSGMNPESVARALLALTLDVAPEGAFVRIGEEYQLLRRGDLGPIPIDGPLGREMLSNQLDVPPAEQDGEVQSFELDAADGNDERDLRRALRTPAEAGGSRAFDLLNVAARVRGFGPRAGVPARRSPDIVLLAPRRQSFRYGKSTHGALSYAVTRVPMMFFGRPINGVHSIPQADMVDFTPTVLSLLGINSTPFALDGRPLVFYDGRPILRRPPLQDGIVVTGELVITRTTQRPTRRAAADLTIADAREVQPADVAADVPWAVMLAAHASTRRSPKLTDESTMLYEFNTAELNVIGLTEEPAWIVDAAAPARGKSPRVPLQQTRHSVRMTSGDLVQDLWVPRVLAVRLLSLELPALPDWLRLTAQHARKLIVPLRFTPRTLPACAGAPGFLSNLLLDADTFLMLVTHAGARADGARILAAEEAIAEALRAAPAASRLVSSWAAAKDAARTSRSHSVEAYDAAIASLRAAAIALPGGAGTAILTAATSLQNRVLKFPRPKNDREKVETAVRMLQRIIQSRETLTLRVPGIHQGW